MADNVNIIVQDTINDIVVNAAQIVETIDINVQAAVDVVNIVANPNNYVVNINRIIGEQVQSDWTQNDNQAPDYIKNKPTLAAVATSGDYDDLINKPTIPTNTSDLVNDGENGVDPFITAADIPPVTGFVPYTGATEDVNLGEFGLLTGNVEFDTTPTNIPTTAGAMYWNDADGTADLILKGGNVKLQIGQESVIRVVNKTATNINLLEANYQAVRVTGAQGQRLKVDLAQATTDNLSAETIGLVTETINNNQEGFITTSGLVRNINTTGSLQGETWADGDILYLSPTTAGNVTKVKPTAPNHLVIVGYVVHAHANQGSIFVKVDNGYELDELHNVKITSAANNNVLAYTSATDIWENKTVETALGYTPENVANKSTSTSLGTSDTLYPTQNAVKVYADTKFTLPALTSGSVLFSNGTTIAQKNASFFWDNTNNRLGINNPTPFSSVTSTVNGLEIGIYNSVGNEGNLTVRGFASLGGITRSAYGAVGSNYYLDSANALRRRNADSVSVIDFASGGFLFKTAGNAAINTPISLTELMRINANGNVLINTTTDAGFKLDVNGTARVTGNLTIDNLNCNAVRGSFFNTFNNGYTVFQSFIASGNAAFYNSVSVGTTATPVSSAVLEAVSTTKGFLPPRMTTTQKNAIATPAAGLVVYDTTDNKHYGYNGTSWNAFY